MKGNSHLANGTICLDSEKTLEVKNFVKLTNSLKMLVNNTIITSCPVVSSCKELSEGRYWLNLRNPLRTCKIIFDPKCL